MKPNKADQITRVTKLVAIVLALWLSIVWIVAQKGTLLRAAPGTPPVLLLLMVLLPIVLFLGAFRLSQTFREFVLTFDPRIGAAIQAWRFAGLGFIALYAHRVLPGAFAIPAGLGDMAIGVTAPWVLLKLMQNPQFGASPSFVNWNLLGILDLIVAVSSGGLNSMFARGIPGEITTQPMVQLPLVLIPAYFVPVFMMLHLSALFQARQSTGASREEHLVSAPAPLVPETH
jgi:hypothetical protein